MKTSKLLFKYSYLLTLIWLTINPISIRSQSHVVNQEKRAKELINKRQFDLALEVYDQILAENKEAENIGAYYNTVTQQLFLYQRLNQYKSAFQLVKEAISFHQLLLPDTLHTKIGQLYNFQSNNAYRLRNLNASIKWANRAIGIFEQLDEPSNIAKAKLNIALCYFNQNKIENSIQLLKDALATFSAYQATHPQELGETLFYLGIVHKHQYHLDIAIDFFRQALPYSIEAKDSIRIGYEYNNLGIALGQQYDFQEGLESCIKALDIFSVFFRKEHPSLGYAYNGIGNSYYEQGKFQAAYEYYKLGFQHFKNLFGLENINTTGLLMNMGLMLQEMEAFEEALKVYQEVVAIQARTVEKDYDNFKVHRNIGLTYLQMGDSLRAQQKFEYALSIGNQFLADNSMDWVNLFLDLARIADDAEQSKEWTQRAFQIFYEEKDSPLALEEEDFEFALQRFTLFKVIHAFTEYEWQLFKQRNDPNLLDKSYQLARKGIEFADYIWQHQRTDESKLEFIKLARNHIETTIQISRSIYETRADSTILNDLFQLIEKHKALLLAEEIEDRSIKFDLGIPDSLLKEEQTLSRLIFEEQKRLLKQKTDAPLLKDSTAYYNTLFQLKEKLSGLQQSIATNYPKYYQLKYDNTLLSIEEIQSNLSDKELLIDYMFDDQGLNIFAIQKEEIFYHYQLIQRDKLSQQLSQFQSLIHRPNIGSSEQAKREQLKAYQQLALQLYETLLSPILKEFNTIQKLLIVPDGMLGYLPFELLLDEASTDKNSFRNLSFLLKRYSIRYEYSAKFALPSKTKIEKPLSSLLAFAPDFKSNDSYSTLAFNNSETNTIQQLIGGKVFTGTEATETNFKSLAEQHGILHIASHASVKDSAPNFSHLVFTTNTKKEQEDNLLHAYELYGLSLHAQLAVLSACETGTGQLQTGEGIMSLSRAFKYAGCSSIITSLWKAEDQSTYQIMVQLYKMLKEDKSKDEALRQAKLNFLAESEQQYTHPFYWGTFVLIGNEEALIFEHDFQWEMLFLFLIVLIAIGSIFLLRRRVKFKSNG